MTSFRTLTAYDPKVFTAKLAQLADELVPPMCKGIPTEFSGSFRSIANAGYKLGDRRLPLPVALLRESAMQRNRSWMSAYLNAAGAKLAPHGKTTLAPEIFRMQLEDGVWGLTAATAQQLSFFAGLGVRRLILANQVVGDGNIAELLECTREHPSLDLYVLVDSRENVDQLVEATTIAEGTRPLKLLLEIGVLGGRTGLRDSASALELARHIRQSKHVVLSGVEGYEGIIPGNTLPEREGAVADMVARMRDIASRCDEEDLWGCDNILLTAGGTEFFDLCARGLAEYKGKRPHTVVIRSGCYVTSDSVAYARAFERIIERSPQAAALGVPLPEAALEVWAAIQSRPEAELAFATLGKRDISHDWHMPIPVRWMRPGVMIEPQALPEGHEVLRLNDQHAYLKVPAASPLAVGDLVGFGVSHACTTFDKWRCLLTVDDEYRVTGAIRTFF